MDTKLDRARNIIRNNPGLIWYTTGYENLSAEAIAAMKAFALGHHAKWKDYIDLYFVFQHHTLQEVVDNVQYTIAIRRKLK